MIAIHQMMSQRKRHQLPRLSQPRKPLLRKNQAMMTAIAKLRS
jgi:hypothetical protein